MLRDMRELKSGAWGLQRARQTAREVESSADAVRALMKAMFADDPELRVRAADVARRITEKSAAPLWPHADALAGLLAEVDLEERRTRWHLGLVVARTAHTREQRLRAARLMELLATGPGEVRCSAIEGIALLASEERSLRAVAEEIIERTVEDGTTAQRNRAEAASRRLERP
jgi:hypothetical protein